MATKKTPTKPAATTKKTTPKTKVSQVASIGAGAAKAGASQLRGHGGGFVGFIREQGVIGLAVGLAIGAAAGDTVKKLVEAFINPVVQLLVGSKASLEAATWTLEIGDRVGEFKWGAFVSSLIALIATALVIYLIIHLLKLDRLDKKKK